ncbi:hypothetical protein AGRA3207_004561 [Actinomadura graeca]|uniref:Recombinase zinc beta ribbon domain-containing protein n=1 Tax=Actinomadura graeca TaxID=2750812 RepID=A0ABX8QXJ3_9ACTN|nr:recombinase zinc beta ribbon domain-containing protein [Actinomadura graeca]QXJ23413.1 hypothetical protein AGRA3207_004561 [Actinomadura graeca]
MTLDEIGADLAGLAISVRVGGAGVTHAPQCRQVGKRVAEEATVPVSELRAGGAIRPCRTCGGAVVGELSATQSERLAALIPVLEERLQEAAEVERAKREEQERIRRADAIDKRAGYIVDAWDWKVKEERRLASRYPPERRTAVVPCVDCDAKATIAFDPRTLEVSYVCPFDSEHGFLQQDGDQEPLTTWVHRTENGLVALDLVAPVLAGADDAWAMTFASRVADYRTTVSSMEDFDKAHPPRMRLTPDVRCGDCGDPMHVWPGTTGSEPRIEAHYSCDNRHRDGKFRHHEKRLVDEEIDSLLHRTLRGHPSWATAKELEPGQGEIAAYADDLGRKLAIFDARAGAARRVGRLVRARSRLEKELDLVTRIRDHGAPATADLTRYAAGGYASYTPTWTFTELARALLTERVDVTKRTVTVVTPFDDGTSLQRLLRSREIRNELAELHERRGALERELADLEKRF